MRHRVLEQIAATYRTIIFKSINFFLKILKIEYFFNMHVINKRKDKQKLRIFDFCYYYNVLYGKLMNCLISHVFQYYLIVLFFAIYNHKKSDLFQLVKFIWLVALMFYFSLLLVAVNLIYLCYKCLLYAT